MQNIQDIGGQTANPLPLVSRTEEILRLIDGLQPDSELVLRGQGWQDYENLIETVGEARGLRIAFDGVTLQIMTLSTSHEKLTRLLDRLIGHLSTALDLEIEFFGSSTIKLSDEMKGLEPDACYYIQNVDAIGGKSEIDFRVDPMPDVAVEIDFHHVSLNKLAIYSSLGIREVWRYFQDGFEFYILDDGSYRRVENSIALPIISSKVLSEFLNRGTTEKQSAILRDFDAWLKKQP